MTSPQQPQPNHSTEVDAYCIVPPTGVYVREDRCQTPLAKFATIALRPPIDLMYAAGAFEQVGLTAALTDYPAEGRAWQDLEAALRDRRPRIVLLSITTQTLEDDLKAAALVKRLTPGSLTVAKGAHFNIHDADTLAAHPELDVVLRGEYEESCRDLAAGVAHRDIAGITWRDADGRIVRNPDRALPNDLDTLAFPARHLANNALYIRPDTGQLQTTLVTNRGCPFSCTYCLANQIAGKANRYRSVANVVAEIRDCIDRHHIRSFLLRSDLFTQNKNWVIELCARIVDEQLDIEWACNSRVDMVDVEMLRAMKQAGCWIVAFGIESGDQETLDRIAKKATVGQAHRAIDACKQAGIRSSAYLMMGFPWDTPQSLDRLIAFARDLDPDVAEFFYPYPFPGTPLARECVDLGLLRAGEIPQGSYSDPAFPTLHMSIKELSDYRNKALRAFYVRPGKIVRTLMNTRSPAEFTNYIRVGLSQLRQLVA